MVGEPLTPLVSVVVPVHNEEPFLRHCLDSIVGQTYPRMEIVVMDDGSTDRSWDITVSYGSRLRPFRQPVNRGQFANVNDGIKMARGDYIAVYHADDIYDSEIVSREVDYLRRHPEAGAVFCLDVFIDAEGREYGRLEIPRELRSEAPLPYPAVLNGLLRYKNAFLVGPTAMVRASAYEELGVFRGEIFGIASDLEMWLRIARVHPIGVIAEHLHYYRHGHGSLSERYNHLRTEPERHFQILDRDLEEGGRALATPDSLAAHEAHRAEDWLMVAINHYIVEDLSASKDALRKVTLGALLPSDKVQRFRLSLLLLAMRMLVRLPWLAITARMFYARWHGDKAWGAPTMDASR
jgi:glycosyltransferase involved in cell wall biosynthesis